MTYMANRLRKIALIAFWGLKFSRSARLSLILAAAGGLLLAPLSAFAQFTTVSATVTDPNGIPYANGSISAILVPGTSGAYTLSGSPYSGRLAPTGLDSTGSVTVRMGDNGVLLPAGSQWLFTVSSNLGGIPLPLGTGSQSFTATITITGGTQNISATLSAAAPALGTAAAGGSPCSVNKILYVNANCYSTIAAALATCPATGVEIISTTPETFTVDPFAAATCPFDVWLIGGTTTATWKTNVPLRVAGHNGQRLHGAGPNFTIIQANSGTFPINSTVVSVGGPAPGGVNGSGVFDLAVDCASVTGCSGIALDGAQELSGTFNTQVVNCMADCYQISSAQGAGAGQNQMILDHIRATGCAPTAPVTCVPIHILSTAGFRVSVRDATAVAVSPATVTDCIKNDSTNSTPFLETIHVEACTNGFHNTAAGGTFEVDNMFGLSSVPTMVLNDSSSAGYMIRQMTLDGSTNSLVDTGRSITTASPFCTAYGVATSFVSCDDRAVPYQFASSLRITPPLGAGSGIQEQLLAGFTGSSSAVLVLDNLGASNLDFKNDGRPCFRGNQTGAFLECPTADTLTASRFPLYPNGPSATVMTINFQTAGATTSDVITIQGMTAGGHCPALSALNALAATGMAAGTTWIDTLAANAVTLHHTATNGQLFHIGCTSN